MGALVIATDWHHLIGAGFTDVYFHVPSFFVHKSFEVIGFFFFKLHQNKHTIENIIGFW